MSRKLTHHNSDGSAPLPPDTPRVTLIVAIVFASISLLAASLTCWWFAIMKRSFRHHLIMLLIVSDMSKALWFFVFPLVIFISGPISSSSSFCQAGAFLLAQATEASDFAALMLALHLVTCVFRPPKRGFQGGIHSFRRLIFLLWVCLPILAASLAFVNDGNAYVSYGAFCYLPEQPIWYRMVLSWVPRYIVFVTIFSAAFIVTIHVHVNFKRFGHPEDGEMAEQISSQASITTSIVPHSSVSRNPPEHETLQLNTSKPPTLAVWQSPFHPDSHHSGQSTLGGDDMKISEVSIPASGTLPNASQVSWHGGGVKDFAPHSPLSSGANNTMNSGEAPQRSPDPNARISRTLSGTPPLRTDSDLGGNCGNFVRARSSGTDSATEELLTHRHSIERHLRILFLYPTSYMLVWTFPFVSQCFQLNGRHFETQPLWLQVITTGVLALQASVDAAIFSYRERPWKRARGHALVSKAKLRRLMWWRSPADDEDMENEADTAAAADRARLESITDPSGTSVVVKGPVCWWEEEGRKRRDSVWMGTDALTLVKSRQPEDGQPEEAVEEAVEEEGEDRPSSEIR